MKINKLNKLSKLQLKCMLMPKLVGEVEIFINITLKNQEAQVKFNLHIFAKIRKAGRVLNHFHKKVMEMDLYHKQIGLVTIQAS